MVKSSIILLATLLVAGTANARWYGDADAEDTQFGGIDSKTEWHTGDRRCFTVKVEHERYMQDYTEADGIEVQLKRWTILRDERVKMNAPTIKKVENAEKTVRVCGDVPAVKKKGKFAITITRKFMHIFDKKIATSNTWKGLFRGDRKVIIDPTPSDPKVNDDPESISPPDDANPAAAPTAASGPDDSGQISDVADGLTSAKPAQPAAVPLAPKPEDDGLFAN